jgi:hypothetical protein
MQIVLDTFEQSIEDNAGKFVPLSDAERTEVETIINMSNKHGFIREEFYHEPHEQGANQEGERSLSGFLCK